MNYTHICCKIFSKAFRCNTLCVLSKNRSSSKSSGISKACNNIEKSKVLDSMSIKSILNDRRHVIAKTIQYIQKTVSNLFSGEELYLYKCLLNTDS